MEIGPRAVPYNKRSHFREINGKRFEFERIEWESEIRIRVWEYFKTSDFSRSVAIRHSITWEK